MIRVLAIVGVLACLGACNSDPVEGNAWYQHGDANYDALKAAKDACVQKGGDYQLQPGGDPTHLGDYACNPKKAS